MAIRCGAVRQKSSVIVCPQMSIQRVQPLVGANLDNHPPASLQAALQQVRQDGLKRPAFQMVEEDLWQAG
jgi:hypothetical protein